MPPTDELAATAERSLIAGASNGSTDALAKLFHRYAAEVHRTAYRGSYQKTHSHGWSRVEIAASGSH
jgi:hypothetical protein